jgi:hypothetical protein
VWSLVGEEDRSNGKGKRKMKRRRNWRTYNGK